MSLCVELAFGRGYGPVLRQTMELTNERTNGHITINCTNRNLHLQKQWIYVYTVKLHDGLKRAETCCLRNSVLCPTHIHLPYGLKVKSDLYIFISKVNCRRNV